MGILWEPSGRVLIAKRPASVHQGNLWEFPGGKCEQGETPRAALVRELAEELAVDVLSSEALCIIEHDYGDKRVRLHVQTVSRFEGTPEGVEGQPLRWVRPFELWQYRFPAANRAILRHIALPKCLAIADKFPGAKHFEESFRRALSRGVDGLYLRVPVASPAPEWLYPLASTLCDEHGCLLFLPADAPAQFARGRHWRANQWVAGQVPGYPQSAAVHSLAELFAAQTAGADLLLISPVKATASHPAATPIGWEGFGAMVRESDVPALALGGMAPADCERSLAIGGSGVAGISAFWHS